jgi:hypothetical protein
MATTNYAAAIDTGDILLSYGAESVWGTAPAVAFQQLRMLSESLAGTKSRTRPSEITGLGQAAAALTTKVEAGGDIAFALSVGTYDDFLAASIRGAWGSQVDLTAATIAATGTGFTDSGSGFVSAGIEAGQFLHISGFSNSTIDGFYRIDTVVAGTLTTTPAPATTETLGASVTIEGTMVRNAKVFQSFFFQKELASNLFLNYAGAWPTGGSVDVGVGDFTKGTFNFLAKGQASATSDTSTGSQVAPTTGRIVDAISGISELRRNGVAVDAIIQKMGLKWSAEGARTQMGIGSAEAQGIGTGQIMVSGTLETYFKDFSLYDEFISETGGPISFLAQDNTGAGYMFTVTNATIMNPKVVAGGPNQDVMASFELEGNPGASLFGSTTIQIDKFTA